MRFMWVLAWEGGPGRESLEDLFSYLHLMLYPAPFSISMGPGWVLNRATGESILAPQHEKWTGC